MKWSEMVVKGGEKGVGGGGGGYVMDSGDQNIHRSPTIFTYTKLYTCELNFVP